MTVDVDGIYAELLGGRTPGTGGTPPRGRKCLRCEVSMTLAFMCQRCEKAERRERASGYRYVADRIDDGAFDERDERSALRYLSFRHFLSRSPHAVARSVIAGIDGAVEDDRQRLKRERDEKARAEALLVHRCDICPRKFASAAGLRTHRRAHKAPPAPAE